MKSLKLYLILCFVFILTLSSSAFERLTTIMHNDFLVVLMGAVKGDVSASSPMLAAESVDEDMIDNIMDCEHEDSADDLIDIGICDKSEVPLD
ncbi:MAG: hypothetical protein HAW67_02545 [Endozoicomonadaceae bacterium]|nr:hypothetical protein [Endozoicomonadaceae bacterium]